MSGAKSGGDAERPGLPATSWAVLGLLSFGEELSGYDLKKWADWSLRFFYWSPSFSQIYGELKRLENAGYVTSRMVAQETGNRDKRVYRITDEGMEAVRTWAREAPVEPPVLKHGVMLRLWLGHLLEPEQMREVLARHREYAETMRQRAEADAEGGRAEEAWAYPVLTLKWAERYYASERDLADAMLADLEELERRRP
ncbi:PadR family transcriptional regulator [Streptomyces roseochromogenus]|uniref:PadR family transcriptional regulator n=1 Tax=Streptomyces roseochromogenus subsp. oscitans DS 12.976 TaxID=1352936 RepID=V6KX02_STRRC|nr:PadR family transcriptional regulator [Streptomyces roseochromogenus]EST36558.1 PadR family transcriptional regulator [Streptomyces roseochromogenus subsp. oscitans DS 12.976]